MQLRGSSLSIVGALLALPLICLGQPPHEWRCFTQVDGLPENACRSITIGASGNLLIRHVKTACVTIFDGYEFTTLPAPGTNWGRIYESPGGQLWTVAHDGLLEFRDGGWCAQPVPQLAAFFRSGRTNEVVLHPIRQGIVVISLPMETLRLDATDPDHARIESVAATNAPTSTPEFTNPAASLQVPESFFVRRVYDVQTDSQGRTWFATYNGLICHTRELWQPSTPPPETVAPDDDLPARAELDLPPGGWKVIHKTKSGEEWIGGVHGIAWRRRGAVQLFTSTNQLGPEEVFTFAESPDDRLWCATPHKVWEFDGRNWLSVRTSLDQINAMHCARDGTLWVGTSGGIVRLTQGAWLENGIEEGLPPAEVQRIREDAAGGIYIETSAGWAAFHPAVDPDPPRTGLTPGTPLNFREDSVVTLGFSGRDKWKLTAPQRLLYAYRLDERDWSPFQQLAEITFPDLPLGKHYFQVRAMDRAGNIDPKPARLEFSIIVPWYRETRIVLILSLALGVALLLAAVAFNQRRKLALSYAEVERQVAERTRELEIANRGLLHSQKMNALGTLAAGIAHDFNNILSIIKGSVQIIEDHPGDPEKIQRRVDRIKIVVQQGAEVVDAMLGFTRSTDQPPAPCDINAVVDETRKLLGDRFLREVEVRFESGEILPEVSVPRDFVQQILLNFIFNAAEAMTSRKEIVLSTRLVDQLPTDLVLAPAAASHHLLIAVHDTGSGIAPEIKARIFEPFFTTKALSTKRGTGLGLSMVYQLAQKMHAGLAVASGPGQGSTFTLILPVSPTKAQP